MFVCDSVAIVVIIYMGLRDDRRPKGAEQTSLFRMRDVVPPPNRRGRPRS